MECYKIYFMCISRSTKVSNRTSLIQSCVKLILLFVPSIFILRFYFESSSQSIRAEETVRKYLPGRYGGDQVMQHSTVPTSRIIYDIKSYASKHQSSRLPSYSDVYSNHRRTYDYETSMLMGARPRPLRFDDNQYLDIQ
jgi:hypothetical protein